MKQELTLAVLITTMNSWIERVKNELLPQLSWVDEVIISHQITDKNIIPESENLWMKVKYLYMYDSWVSKNRNNAIKYLESDIWLICDDDINYIDGFIEIIKDFYSKNDYDIVTFEFIDESWETLKGYKSEWSHSFLSLLSIWWIEISFRKKSLWNILFDEDFWFSAYISGEDNIFLTDCYKNNLKMYHCKKIIWIHPKWNSWDIWGKNNISDKWAVFFRIFWILSYLVNIYFAIIKYKEYKKNLWFFHFLFLIQKWSFDFMISK